MKLIKLLYHYWRAKRLYFRHQDQLHTHQNKQLRRFFERTLIDSPYFVPYLDSTLSPQEQLSALPIMNKDIMMTHFDTINTAHLALKDVLACAYQAEQSRDFSSQLQGYSVGLSSGTTAKRGAFLVSDDEQARWAGVILAKLLPKSLFRPQKIAFFLRANNNLYQSVRSPSICFEFFDLFDTFEQSIARLIDYKPTIIVAPASLLQAIALHDNTLAPTKVISVAEVLDEQTKRLLTQRFGVVQEVYQATEGFLACSCRHGRLHLNEEYLYIEKQWLDDTRFVPIITDFSRTTQPIARYRLDDVLVIDNTPCPCGSATQVIAKIEGRQGDTLLLPSFDNSPVMVFADVCERILAQVLPLECDYQLDQLDDHTLALTISQGDDDLLHACQVAFCRAFDKLGVNTASLNWQSFIVPIQRDFTQKRRRIKNHITTQIFNN